MLCVACSGWWMCCLAGIQLTVRVRLRVDVSGNSDPLKVYNKFNLTGLIALAPHLYWGYFLEEAGINILPAINVAEPTVLSAVDAIVVGTSVYVATACGCCCGHQRARCNLERWSIHVVVAVPFAVGVVL